MKRFIHKLRELQLVQAIRKWLVLVLMSKHFLLYLVFFLYFIPINQKTFSSADEGQQLQDCPFLGISNRTCYLCCKSSPFCDSHFYLQPVRDAESNSHLCFFFQQDLSKLVMRGTTVALRVALLLHSNYVPHRSNISKTMKATLM